MTKFFQFTRLIYLLILLLCGCTFDIKDQKKFSLVPSTTSKIVFNNILTETDSLNYFNYAYMYMGGGVSIGDINNDGLADVYFTGNMVPNKLYLNKGNLVFEDISEMAGVSGDSRWYTGTTMADVNNDGLLDLYVSVSGKSGLRENQLFINNGNLTFSEKAAAFGLADTGEIIQSYFFDYDKDGDLDVFMAHYPSTSFNTPNTIYQYLLHKKELSKSDRLYQRQSDGTYKDVTLTSGIANFGLAVSAAIADYNNDGYDDIYVSNDFSTPDFLYLNNGDGTFTDSSKKLLTKLLFTEWEPMLQISTTMA